MPLCSPRSPPIFDLSDDILAVCRNHPQGDVAVAEENAIAFVDGRGQGAEGGADAFFGAGNIARGDDEALAEAQANGFAVDEFAGADFRPLQIGEHADGFFIVRGSTAQGGDHAHAVFMRAVGKIQAGDVHAGVHQLVYHVVRRGDRAQGTDYFCSARIYHDYLFTEKSFTIAKRNSMPL